jgi:hypothetical protein
MIVHRRRRAVLLEQHVGAGDHDFKRLERGGGLARRLAHVYTFMAPTVSVPVIPSAAAVACVRSQVALFA